jgi:hypothetical protein
VSFWRISVLDFLNSRDQVFLAAKVLAVALILLLDNLVQTKVRFLLKRTELFRWAHWLLIANSADIRVVSKLNVLFVFDHLALFVKSKLKENVNLVISFWNLDAMF